MSADDSIEIEFPSLKQSAPQLVERAEPNRAPGPIEAQLSSSPGDDDLSWLTAIFADDDDDDDDDGAPDDSDEGSPDLNAELPAGGDDLPDDHPTNGSTGPDASRGDLVEDTNHDPRSGEFDDDAADALENGEPGEPYPPGVAPDQEPIFADGDPADVEAVDPVDAGPDTKTDGNDPEPSSTQVTGFREEIMSTFSQMYK